MTELPFQRDRPVAPVATPISLAQLRSFDEVIDARSPAEFAEDHLPGAINAPVLDDAERAQVGTVFKRESAFDAKRVGAPLAARNIARHIERTFFDRPRRWRPLVYCWRGGGRSAAMVHMLRQVAAELETMPRKLRFHVICGATGSGKSRLLEALARTDAQVLDLEALAAHRGSVLGELPDAPQPAQKAFETSIWTALSGFDPARPVFVESESKKVGNLRVPEELIVRMRESRCIRLEASTATRVALLMQDYAHFVQRPSELAAKLDCLKNLHGAERIEAWKERLDAGAWESLVRDLLESHYDPAYRRSLLRNYRDAATATPLAVEGIGREAFGALAARLLRTP